MTFPRSTDSPARRLLAAAALTALVAAGLAACDMDDDATVVLRTDAEGVSGVSADSPGQATAAASALAYESAQAAVVGAPEGSWAVAQKVNELGVPGLLVQADSTAADESAAADDGAGADAGADDREAVVEELDRLGVETVFVPSDQEAPDALGDRTVVTYNPETLEPEDGDAPEVTRDGDAANAALFVDRGSDRTPGQEVASASVETASGTVAELPGGDPRASSETVEAAEAAEGSGVLAVGDEFGDDSLLTSRLDTARTAPELPGGGQAPFPGRRMIAAYGAPGIPSMGILGEQDLDATVDRVEELAAEYEPHSEEQIVPAMEIITTVASDQPGADGNYSTELDPQTLRPWIDRAAEEGIYVVLDLQPGTSSFPEQAKLYEDLLKEPHVGLALDSEWRLEDGQRHLAQIGSVGADEINETADWLAELTAENDLPQKVFVMHQFSMSMITDRQDIDTSHDELAMVLHADGHGTPELKLGTWNALQEGLPEGIRMAWKNFYDEDTPTFTPEQTMDVDPAPWFVSYQ